MSHLETRWCAPPHGMPVDPLEPGPPGRECVAMSETASARRRRSDPARQAGPRLEGVARLSGAAAGPGPRPGYVSRPHLVGKLIRSPAGVALIAAPAGYGKTTLAREWDDWDARPFAWVTLEREHDDCASGLVSAIEEALDEA